MSFLVVLRKMRQRWFGGAARGGRRRRRGPGHARPGRTTRPALELLEDRTLLSVLPPPTVTGQTAIFNPGNNNPPLTSNSPQVAVDPTNPNNLVTVFTTNLNKNDRNGQPESIVQGAFSTNAGQTWTLFDVSGSDPQNEFVSDPTTNNPVVGFSMATDPTVAFDRDVAVNPATGQVVGNHENFYVVFSEHRADNSAGAIMLQKFDFHTGFPVPVTVTPTPEAQINAQNFGSFGGLNSGILYEWAPSGGSDPALNPVVAVDTGLPPVLTNPANPGGPKVSFIDPTTGATQTDNFVVPLIDAVSGKVVTDAQGNPISQGEVYVAWNTNNAAPTGPIYGDQFFNPNVVKIIASSDGAQTFTTQRFLNNGNFGSPNDSSTLNPKEGFSAPRLVVSQGTSSDRPTVTVNGQPVAPVQGGQLTGVWTDFAHGSILSTQVQNGGTAVLLTNPTFTFLNDAIAGANGAPASPGVTLSSQVVNITDPNFKLSDLDVSVALVHPNDQQLRLTLLPESQLFHAVDVAINPADGNVYISSENSNSVVEYNGTTGALIRVFVTPGQGGLVEPTGLIWGPDGDLYVSSAGTGQVMRYSIDPNTKQAVSAPAAGQTGAVYTHGDSGALVSPAGVTFGPDGNLYVSSNGNDQVLEYQGPAKAQPGLFGTAFVPTNKNGTLKGPEGLVFGPDGSLYVASSGNNAVMRYAGPGVAAPLTPGAPFPSNPADATDAIYASGSGMVNPFGVTFGADGQLYVSEGSSVANSGVLRFSGPNLNPTKPTAPQGPLDPKTTPGQFLGNFIASFFQPTDLSKPGGLVFAQRPGGTVASSNGNPSLDGDLFVVDQGNDRVLRFTPVPGDPQPASGQTGATFVTPGSGNLANPQSMVFRPFNGTGLNGDFLVADFANNSVERYDTSTGAFQSTYVVGGSLQGPTGLAEYPFGGLNANFDGVLFVASQKNGLILEYKDGSTPNSPATFLGTFAVGLLNPTSLTWDSSGSTLYVAEGGANDIIAFDRNGNRITGTGEPTGVFASDTNLKGPTGLTLGFTGDLLVSSNQNDEVLSFSAATGGTTGTVVTSPTVNPSPLVAPQDMAVDFQTNSLYVVSAGTNQVLRFDLSSHKYLESVVPAGNNAANGAGLNAPHGIAVQGGFNFTQSGNNFLFQSFNDLYVTSTVGGQGSVLRYTAQPAQDAPSGNNSGADFVTAGGGGTAIDLVENHLNAAGKSNGDNPFFGITGANIGVEPLPNNGNGIAVGATFDQEAARNINDPSATAPYIGHFQPEGSFFFGGSQLSDLYGQTPTQLNGIWTLEITDFVHDTNPNQFLQSWSLNLTSGLDAQPDQVVVSTTKINNIPQPGSPLLGSPTSDGSSIGSGPTAFPNAGVTRASPDRGIGPGPVLAADNTLGSFSPFQGRLYLAYTGFGDDGVGTINNRADNTDIFLLTSDDGGNTWSRTPRPAFFSSSPPPVNDDSIHVDDQGNLVTDSFSEGNRPQFDPSIAVDQATGTLVLSWLDARNDAARARVATYLATSLDGGATFAPETFVNAATTAVDAITGQTVTLGPTPDNMSAGITHDTRFDFGDRQGLAVADGHVYPVWAGNENATHSNGAALSEILTASVTIAAGPRVVSSTMGAVKVGTVSTDQAAPATFTVNGTFANDGTEEADGFLVTFDRPIAADSFLPGDVTIEFRDPEGDAPITIPTNLISVHPIDGYTTRFGAARVGGVDPNTGLPFLSTTFLVRFGLPASITNPVGTYSYDIAPSSLLNGIPVPIADRIRFPLTTITGVGAPVTFAAGAGQTNLVVPPQDSGGDGFAGPPFGPEGPPPNFGFDPRDTTFSTITIPAGSTSVGQFLTHVAVTVNIQHTFDSDLIIDLIAPDGTIVPLSINRPNLDFGGNRGFLNTTFDDNAARPISAGSDPFTGTFRPDSPLSALRGQVIKAGDVWRLAIDDTAGGDTGRLVSWSLSLTSGTGLTTVQDGNSLDQNANANPGEVGTAASLGDDYEVPTPTSKGLFQLPFDPKTVPLIVPGPHVVQTFVPGVDAGGNPINPPTPDNLVLNGSAPAIDVVFDRDMDPASVANPAALLRLIGPYGNIPLTTTDANGNVTGFAPGVTITPDTSSQYPRLINGQTTTADDPDPAHPRTYRITLPARPNAPTGTQGPDLSGTYTLSLAPLMKSEAGDPLDTNQNAGLDLLRGVASDAARATFVNVSHAYSSTVDPTDVPVAIAPNKTIDVPISFTEQFAVEHVRVQLNIQYPNDPDLQAVLISPTGTRVQLFSHPGNFPGSKANFSGTIFDDTASAPIQTGRAPFNGTFNPQLQLDNPITGFFNQSSKGTWLLEIENDGSNSGQLLSWALTLQEAVPGTGLGEPVADQATASFRIFTQDPQNVLAHDVWTAIGPAGINGGGEGLNAGNTGRIGGLAFDPSDPTGNTAFVAGASGGVWKTTNFLTTNPSGPIYVPLTDFGPNFAINIGSIAVFGRNNDPRQSIVIASTGEGDTGTTGVGFLRSLDGGSTWTLLDSTVNVFDSTNDGGNRSLDGQFLPINSPLRDHKFVGTTSFKVVVDPQHAPTGPGDVIVYAALSGTNGGLWRSLDSGNHWQLMSDPAAEGSNATDVTLAAAEFNQNGNLRVVYAAFQGHGVYLSGQQGANLTLMAGAATADALIQDGDKARPTPIPVNNPSGASPNGAFGRIVLAAPPLIKSIIDPNTHLPLFTQEAQDPQNVAYSQWLYAVVVNTDDTLHGLFLTKDAGATWTQVHLPEERQTVGGFTFGLPTNDDSRPDHDPFGDPTSGLPAQGNYDVSLAIDPNNPNVVYLGGANDLTLMPAGGLLRVDTTGIEDSHNLTAGDNDNPDGGLSFKASQGDLNLKNPLPVGSYGVIQQLPDGSGVGTFIIFPGQNTPFLNLVEDPNNPFFTNAPILVTGVTAFNNTGQDAHYKPFNAVLDSTDQHRVMAIKDPITGLTRLVFGDDQGVFSVVDDGTGNILTGLGQVNAAGVADVQYPSTSRNGNLQITQFYYGAAQPSILAAEIAGALQQAGGLFYGNAQDDGFPVSDPHLLTNGNISWNGPAGDGSGIATDQTGSGTAYSYQWPATGIDSGLGFSNFFLVNPNGTGYISRTGTAGFNLNPTDRTQWPLLASQFGPNLAQSYPAVNPINGDQVLISSATGTLYRTDDQGRTWFVAGSPAQLDGTYVSAPAYGAPDPADPSVNNLDDFLYAGTAGGNLFVSLDGGAHWTKLNGAGNLDGSPVVSVSANPVRGTHEAYVTTLNGVFHVSFSASYPTGAAPVVSNVAWTNNTGAGAGNLFNLTTNFSQTNNGLVPLLPVDTTKPAVAEQHLLSFLSAMAVDWRYVIPDATGGGTHPVLYVGGNAGVYRSVDNGQTWALFPNQANNGAPVEGGYLATAQVTHLDLSVGNINPTTGLPDQSTGPNVLVATTFGRGDFAIRLDNQSPFNQVAGPRIVALAPVQDPATPGAVDGVTVTFGVRNPDNSITPTSVDPSTFKAADVIITGPNGPVSVIGVMSVSPQHNVYLISFNPQTVQGDYTVTVGPQITDFSGHFMDQDGEGDATPDADDAFTGTFSVTSANANGLHVTGATADSLTSPPGISSITVSFNIAVDPTTFHSTDVTLVGPNGNVVITSLQHDPSGTVWTVGFATQTVTGTYTLTVANTLKDTSGNFIDQDEDGAPFQSPTDGFSTTFVVSAPSNQGGGGGTGSTGTPAPLPPGPIPPGVLVILPGPIVPLRDRHHHVIRGKFTQLVQIFNVGNQPIRGPIALVIDGLMPIKRRGRFSRLVNPLGVTAIGSPFQLSFVGLDPFNLQGAVFTLQYSASSAGAINPFFRFVSGIPLF